MIKFDLCNLHINRAKTEMFRCGVFNVWCTASLRRKDRYVINTHSPNVSTSRRRVRRSLTSLAREVHIFIDGAEEVLLLTAELPGSEDVPDALMEVRILALRRGASRQQSQNGKKPPEMLKQRRSAEQL